RRAAGRDLPVTVVPPGVDPVRFAPLDEEARAKARALFDLPADGRVVVSLSRLVPRKGMDVLVEAVAELAPDRPDLVLAIRRPGPPPRPGARPGPAGALRLRRRLRHALPQPVGGPRAGGLRHRLPRGRGLRGAPGGRRQRRCPRGGGRRRDRPRRPPAPRPG